MFTFQIMQCAASTILWNKINRSGIVTIYNIHLGSIVQLCSLHWALHIAYCIWWAYGVKQGFIYTSHNNNVCVVIRLFFSVSLFIFLSVVMQ